MLTPDPPIRLTGPAEVVAMVPYLIGFHPSQSLVVVALTGTRVAFGSRTALPTEPDDTVPYRALMDRLATIMVNQHATGALLVGYGCAPHVITAVTVATAALTAVDLPVHDAQRVADGRIFSLVCTNPECCPPQGTPFDPTSSVTAARATVAGLVALPDRDALAQQVAPITGPARAAFAAATHTAADQLRNQLDGTVDLANADDDEILRTPPGRAMLRHGRRAVAEALDTYRAGNLLDTERAARLTVLLQLSAVRDFALAKTCGEDWQISMWTDLLRRVEPAFTAGPAILLAVAALQAGNGALANCAIDRALDADPSHRLANLVLQAIRFGIDPQTVAALTRA